MKKIVAQTQCRGLVCGLSGGIDSAVVACLMKRAFPNQHLTLFMNCESSTTSRERATNFAQKFNLNFMELNLTTNYQALTATLAKNHPDQAPQTRDHQQALAQANLKPRLRMLTLYYYAQLHNYLVVGTGNADEWHLGYFTKHGDAATDLNPLFWLLKQDVRAAASALHITSDILQAVPSADLWPGQTDESEMGVTYNEVDNYLLGNKLTLSSATRIEALHGKSEHKRQFAYTPDRRFQKLIK